MEKIAKVCRVIGTASGKQSQLHTIMSATHTAVCVKLWIFEILVFI